MGRRSHIDWQRGRTLYVHSGLTQSDVARELGVSVRAVQRHSTAESWPAQRQTQAAKTLAIVDDKAVEVSAEQLVEASTKQAAQEAAIISRLNEVVANALDHVSDLLATQFSSPEKVTMEDAIDLLTLIAKIVEKFSLAPTPQAAQNAQGHTTNLIVALQSLGAQGRVAIYRNLADR